MHRNEDLRYLNHGFNHPSLVLPLLQHKKKLSAHLPAKELIFWEASDVWLHPTEGSSLIPRKVVATTRDHGFKLHQIYQRLPVPKVPQPICEYGQISRGMLDAQGIRAGEDVFT
ncbi:hypothetical protein Hypma_004613 [Hypsizygus marmoreus]|uniref:Uncharacterized protein n=1 Tax=Hypsizygus marmoreus TaxID=39966 RepID=A0A369K5M7_HYPMA|nr:hypothetical protein Hypma_004613 [Hypsizygus marmoreus]